MKKLLTILFLFLAFFVKAQDIIPIDTAYHSLATYSFKYYTKDSSVWIYKGAKYQTTKLVSNKRLNFLIDSIASATYSNTYEVEVSTPGVSTYAVPVPLKAKTMVFYNGILVRSNLWSGIGTTSLVVGLQTDIRDYIKIQY